MLRTLSLPNARVDVLDQRFSFEQVAIAQQIPSLFDGRAKALIKIEFPQANDGVGERTIRAICHRCY